MSNGRGRAIGRALRTAYHVGAVRELTDGQLLQRIGGGGEAAELAFAALVERHGPMVLRVCRAIAGDPHAADDAFQATFVVLARKARGLWVRDSIGPWLHRVAARTAACARKAEARRRRAEPRAARPEAYLPNTTIPDDLARALHEEIERLPARLRAAVVLCDVEGVPGPVAARRLGCPDGTLKSRLSRARERLRHRLTRRGHAPTALAPITLPRLPASLAEIAARRSVASLAARPAPAVLLAHEVLRMMGLSQALRVAAVVVGVGGVGLAAGVGLRAGGPDEAPAAVVPERPAPDDGPTVVVRRGPLREVVTLRGTVQAVQVWLVESPASGQHTLRSVLPEGTKVKAGDIVAELDPGTLLEDRDREVSALRKAEEAYQDAWSNTLDAEAALFHYEAEFHNRAVKLRADEAMLAQSDVKRAEDRVDWSEKMVAKGYISLGQLASERLTLERARATLDRAKAQRDVHAEFQRDPTAGMHLAEVERIRAREARALSTRQAAHARVRALREQIDGCRLRAPADGVVAPPPGGRVPEGATVRERQVVARVVDPDGPLEVVVRLPDAGHSLLGRRATIRLDDAPDAPRAGVVRAIHGDPDRTDDEAAIPLDAPPAGTRPGMSATVEIALVDRPGVLSLPARAVVRHDGKDRVAVERPGGGLDWRVVTLGASGDGRVEIRGGLAEGDVVVLDPFADP